MSLEKLGELFYEEERPSIETFREILAEIETDYSERGVQLKEVASGYRFQACHDVGEWVSRLWEEKPQRYSRALLETLALIAYRQPITRGEVEDIRGVSVSSHIVKTLLEREWVRVLGYRDVPGRPAMYGTTKAFLDYFNLKSLEQLPTLAEVRDLDKISAELDARLQQAQPQAALALEGAAAAVDAVNAKAASADVIVDDAGSDIAISDPASSESDRPESGSPDSATLAEAISVEPVSTDAGESQQPHEEIAAIHETADPALAESEAFDQDLLDADTENPMLPLIKPVFASLFDVDPEAALADDELLPSPIQPNDPRLE
jgi:segregation and condensation protein B